MSDLADIRKQLAGWAEAGEPEVFNALVLAVQGLLNSERARIAEVVMGAMDWDYVDGGVLPSPKLRHVLNKIGAPAA
jgi:hypothetical protein